MARGTSVSISSPEALVEEECAVLGSCERRALLYEALLVISN